MAWGIDTASDFGQHIQRNVGSALARSAEPVPMKLTANGWLWRSWRAKILHFFHFALQQDIDTNKAIHTTEH